MPNAVTQKMNIEVRRICSIGDIFLFQVLKNIITCQIQKRSRHVSPAFRHAGETGGPGTLKYTHQKRLK